MHLMGPHSVLSFWHWRLAASLKKKKKGSHETHFCTWQHVVQKEFKRLCLWTVSRPSELLPILEVNSHLCWIMPASLLGPTLPPAFGILYHCWSSGSRQRCSVSVDSNVASIIDFERTKLLLYLGNVPLLYAVALSTLKGLSSPPSQQFCLELRKFLTACHLYVILVLLKDYL